ncbi:hypothetical protein DFH08DRAFT_964080 [Mycena albidolilacea]|uniref:Uncharacterized protein n=1 Tax=Mycena albidolilacea TaxID=1033008 RepID=A0AAD6ZTE9_9AGAR|nr:hypothetical protein DFH08DRAFT_964080 [Mycena albidolilacea]
MESCADLHVAIGSFLDSFAEIDPSKLVAKVKTHLLTHAPADVRLFGPLLGAITEAFESLNGVFRDIEGVKHRVAGGAWPLKGEGNEIVWARCGPSARRLLHEHRILQRLLGWKGPEVRRPGSVKLAAVPVVKGRKGRPHREIIVLSSTSAALAFNSGDFPADSERYKCRNVGSQSQEICCRDSWIVSSSPVPNEEIVTGKIIEILQQTNSTESIVILERFVVQSKRHELYNMPFITCPSCPHSDVKSQYF